VPDLKGGFVVANGECVLKMIFIFQLHKTNFLFMGQAGSNSKFDLKKIL
jgi:hypothetical protein